MDPTPLLQGGSDFFFRLKRLTRRVSARFRQLFGLDRDQQSSDTPPALLPQTTFLSLGDLAFQPDRFLRIHSADFGGLGNRVRCLMTCQAFSTHGSVLCWGVQYSQNPIHVYDFNIASSLFSCPVVASADHENPAPGEFAYRDNRILTPSILGLSHPSICFCMDALNGDGLKSPEMLYLLPDPIFDELRASLWSCLHADFAVRLSELAGMCKQVDYATFSLRYWIDCESVFELVSPIQKINPRWTTAGEFDSVQESIAHHKWARMAPSLSALRAAKGFVQELGLKEYFFLADRFNQSVLATPGLEEIRLCVEAFSPGLERAFAKMTVSAYSKVLCRSNHSTFSHLPLLMNDKWKIRVLTF